jgi:hypothetical protein
MLKETVKEIKNYSKNLKWYFLFGRFAVFVGEIWWFSVYKYFSHTQLDKMKTK